MGTQSEKQNNNSGLISSTMEDYLKAIFELDKLKRVVRVKDIAKKLEVKMPTVTGMLKKLEERGLVRHKKYEFVELTVTGAFFGNEMRRRHAILLRFLTEILKVEIKTAAEEACKLEHFLSKGTLENLIDFMDFVEACPRAQERWPDRSKDC